jgi:hypothetical protein
MSVRGLAHRPAFAVAYAYAAWESCLWLVRQRKVRVDARTLAMLGTINAMMSAMIDTTTINSVTVNPLCRRALWCIRAIGAFSVRWFEPSQ